MAIIERRSGEYGLVVRSCLPDGRKVVKLPKNTTSKQATEVSKLLGLVSFGVVPCGEDYSIRVNPDDVQTARAVVQTDVAAVCSKRLMLTKLEDGSLYIIRAVGKSLTEAQLCNGLWDTISWDTRPR